MTNLSRKLCDSLRQQGFRLTAHRVLRSLLNRYHQLWSLRFAAPEDRFTAIYTHNVWGSEESRSGKGSTLDYTANVRRALSEIMQSLSLHSLFDAPCGDFNWMRELLRTVNVRYVGADIVLPLVQALQVKYASDTIAFMHIDITKGPLPRADLMLCRDCLFHLSYQDTLAFFDRFLEAGIPYLLTTTHDNSGGAIVNRDIRSGGFRPIDLYAPPYNFPRDPLRTIEDWHAPELKRYLCLWSRQHVLQARSLASGTPVIHTAPRVAPSE